MLRRRCAVDVVLCFVLLEVFVGIAKHHELLDLFGRAKRPQCVLAVAEGHGGSGERSGAPRRAQRALWHAAGVLMLVLVEEEELGAKMDLAERLEIFLA